MCKHVLDEPVGGWKRSLLYSQPHKFFASVFTASAHYYPGACNRLPSTLWEGLVCTKCWYNEDWMIFMTLLKNLCILFNQEPINTFLGGPILLSSCFRHNICVRRWMCLSKVAALCYGRRDAQCGQQLLRWSMIYPRRSDLGLKPSRGRAPIHETNGYRRLSAGV